MSDNALWFKLVDVLHTAGLDSLSRQRKFVEQRIAEFSEAYIAHAASFPPGLLPEIVTLKELLEEHDRNPHRVRPIFQAIAFGCSAQMLVMMWLVLLGSTIEELEYKYKRKELSRLTVKLRLPDHFTEVNPPFVSDEHWDFNLLKLAGTSKTNDKPTIESFYALQLRRPPNYTALKDPWMVQVVEWVERFGGSPFCPSLIDRVHIRDVATAIVKSVEDGLLHPAPGGLLASASSDPASRQQALEALIADKATSLSVTAKGRRLLRQTRFYRRFASASSSSLHMVRDALLESLGRTHERDELDELEDELTAINALLKTDEAPA